MKAKNSPQYDPEREITQAEIEVMQFLETPNADPKMEEFRQSVKQMAEEDGASHREISHEILVMISEGMAENLVDEGVALLRHLSSHGVLALEPMVQVLRMAVEQTTAPDADAIA